MKTYEVILNEITDTSLHPDISNNPDMQKRVKEVMARREAQRQLEAQNREKTRAAVSAGKAPSVQVGKGGTGLGTTLFQMNTIKKENMEFRDFVMLLEIDDFGSHPDIDGNDEMQRKAREYQRRKRERDAAAAAGSTPPPNNPPLPPPGNNTNTSTPPPNNPPPPPPGNNTNTSTPPPNNPPPADPEESKKDYKEKNWKEVGEHGRFGREKADARLRGENEPTEVSTGKTAFGNAARQVGDRLGGANRRWEYAKASNLNRHGWKHISTAISKASERQTKFNPTVTMSTAMIGGPTSAVRGGIR